MPISDPWLWGPAAFLLALAAFSFRMAARQRRIHRETSPSSSVGGEANRRAAPQGARKEAHHVQPYRSPHREF